MVQHVSFVEEAFLGVPTPQLEPQVVVDELRPLPHILNQIRFSMNSSRPNSVDGAEGEPVQVDLGRHEDANQSDEDFHTR